MGELIPRTTSPDSFNGFFYHKSWPEPWSSPDFPEDETWQERDRRFESYPWWDRDRVANFFHDWYDGMWPWGYLVYRTCYENVSDAEWKEAMRKLDASVHFTIRRGNSHPEAIRLVCEGFKNAVIEDRELLENASIDQVRQIFNDWTNRHEDVWGPRRQFCLMIDEKSLRSILATPEPSDGRNFSFGPNVGHVVLVENEWWGSYDAHENFRGFYQVDITALLIIMERYSDTGSPALIPCIPEPDHIPCIDEFLHAHVEDQDGIVINADTYSHREKMIGKKARSLE